jgi:hypothetical protein
MFANCFSPLAVVPYLYSYTTCFDLDYSLPYSIHVYLEAKYELNDKIIYFSPCEQDKILVMPYLEWEFYKSCIFSPYIDWEKRKK